MAKLCEIEEKLHVQNDPSSPQVAVQTGGKLLLLSRNFRAFTEPSSKVPKLTDHPNSALNAPNPHCRLLNGPEILGAESMAALQQDSTESAKRVFPNFSE